MQNYFKGEWYKNKAKHASVVLSERKMQNKYNSIQRWRNMFLAVTMVGGENGDAVCLWKGDKESNVCVRSFSCLLPHAHWIYG